MRIGLLGGSFNPAHSGHLYVAEIARRRLGLDYVWWLVTPQNPLKQRGETAPLAERLASVRALIGRRPRMVATVLEQNLGSRYTVDTLKALIRRFPDVRFVWLMGSDNLEQFHLWRRWTEIAALVPIAVVLRPGSTLAPLRAPAYRRFPSRKAISIVDGRRNHTSASALRLGQR